MLRAVFMGSPEFAVASLDTAHGLCQLSAVYTQPDKPRGRGNKMVPTAVKARALELDLPVFEPKRIRDAEVIEQLKELRPEVILVVAYAKLIPPVILELPRLGCVNVHPSLLPKFRGAIPLQASIMAGDSKTGVCTFFMDEGYDTGDLIHCVETDLGPDETGEELSKRLAVVGAEALGETIRQLEAGTYRRLPQPKEAVGGYTKPLKREDFFVDWSQPARVVRNFIRALAHEPAACSQIGELVLKFGRTTVVEDGAKADPGVITGLVRGKGFQVACGEGLLQVEQVKPAGKGWMDAWAYLQGGALKVGQQFCPRPLPVIHG